MTPEYVNAWQEAFQQHGKLLVAVFCGLHGESAGEVRASTAGPVFVTKLVPPCGPSPAPLAPPLALSQHADEHRSKGPVLLAVDQELPGGAGLRVHPVGEPIASASAAGTIRQMRTVGRSPRNYVRDRAAEDHSHDAQRDPYRH